MTNFQSSHYCNHCKKITSGQSRGKDFRCSICNRYTTKKKVEDETKFVNNGYSAQYVVSSEKRIRSIKDVEKLIEFDGKTWKIDRWEQSAGISEGYRKDRKGWWKCKNGKVSGESRDSGKILVVPLHSFKVRVWLSRKTEEIRNELLLDTFSKRAIKYAPKYKKINYKKSGDCLFELELPDMQLGRLVEAEEAGFDISPDIQIKKADKIVDKLISYATFFDIERVLLPVGNDFFDTNSATMTTKKGTPQDDDVRWKRTYKLGCEFIVRTTEKLQQLAKVDVVIVPGNHDQDKIWHLGQYIHAWNHKNPNVVVDNRAKKRKYYSFYKNLIGLSHGYFEKDIKLDSLMSYEVPHLWASSTHREWHLGDKHHKVDMEIKTEELENGVVLRRLRSLADPSTWEFDKGLVGSVKAGESFIWHKEDGVIAQFTDLGRK